MKVSTKIPKLDEFFQGGIEDGSSVLVVSDMLIDKAKFAINLLFNRLSEGDNGIYFLNNKFPDFVKSNIKDFHKFSKRFSVIDGFSYSLGKSSSEDFLIKEKTINVKSYIDESMKVIIQALDKHHAYGTMLVLDALDFWIGHWREVNNLVISSKKKLKETHTISIFLLANLGYKDSDFRRFRGTFDYIIWLRALERKGLVLKQMHIKKPKVEYILPFEFTPSGISLYIPKILVTGPFKAGKSSTVRSLSMKPVSVDRMGTTISLDHGWVERNGLAVDVFGTPGQERFDWILNTLSKSILGIFLVVDSTKPETFERAREMLKKIKIADIPVVILANKQDLKSALSPKRIEKMLGHYAVGTVVIKNKGVDKALKVLFDAIIKRQKWF